MSSLSLFYLIILSSLKVGLIEALVPFQVKLPPETLLIANCNLCHRRDIFRHAIGSIPAFLLIGKGNAAQAYPQESTDKQKIVKGVARLNHLLNNWQELTTVCKASVDNPVRLEVFSHLNVERFSNNECLIARFH